MQSFAPYTSDIKTVISGAGRVIAMYFFPLVALLVCLWGFWCLTPNKTPHGGKVGGNGSTVTCCKSRVTTTLGKGYLALLAGWLFAILMLIGIVVKGFSANLSFCAEADDDIDTMCSPVFHTVPFVTLLGTMVSLGAAGFFWAWSWCCCVQRVSPVVLADLMVPLNDGGADKTEIV